MFSNMAESFSNNLVVEDRYRMILDGLQVTCLSRSLPPCWVRYWADWCAGCA